MTPTLWIPLPLPTINEIIDACGIVRKAGKARISKYTEMKAKWGRVVELYARAQRFPKLDRPFHWEFEHVCKDKRRDPDNLAGGAAKILLDGLQQAGLLSNDGWGQVLSISHTFKIGAPVGVRVTLR